MSVCNCGVTEGIHHASCPIGVEQDKALWDEYEREKLVPSELSKMLRPEKPWSVGNGGTHDVIRIEVLFPRAKGLGYTEMMRRAQTILGFEIERVEKAERAQRAVDDHQSRA